jgi:hypothetical protein
MEKNMKKCLALLCVSFMLLIALTSCRQEAKRRLSGPQEDMVATVGSIPLTSQQVKEMFVQFFTGSEDPELALSETLGHLADQVTLYLGAVEKGLLNESEEDYRDAVARKQLVGMELLQKANPDGSPIEVSKEELEERLPPSFETMRLRILTVEDRGMAEKIRTQILGGASFADKARQFSMDPAASRGGMITTSLFRGDQTGTIFTTDVEEILFSFPEGSITPPIDTGLGWSIFEILERKPFTGEQIMASMEALRTEIRIVKAQNKRLEVQRSHPITIDNEVVKRFASDPASLKDNTVMATIEDLEIPLGEVRAFARWNGISPKTPEDWVQVINAMHMNLAYYVESVKRGMPTPPYISGAIRNARLKRIANRYSEWVKRQIPVTDEQLWQTYVEEISRKMDPAAAGYYALRELKAGSRESAEDAVRELDANPSP